MSKAGRYVRVLWYLGSDTNHTIILFFYMSRDFYALRSKPIAHRHSPMRKIIISPCNYAARIICNPLPSSSAYCFPTRSIEMAFDRVSRRDRIKISGPLSRIRCSPLLFPSDFQVCSRIHRDLREHEIAQTHPRQFFNRSEESLNAFALWRIYFHYYCKKTNLIRKLCYNYKSIFSLLSRNIIFLSFKCI